MQVNHVSDSITHAVIGGAKTIEFEISNSPEFFDILSSTLYKNQKLAVVRETICNAWDAHIEAGLTHCPIVISLTNDKLVIQDMGKGIPADKMGEIYGSYGKSTKKHDGKQTGGFGLGCKSPFAYVSHFEVTSCHAGVKTIYAISKSSGQVMGKPGITAVATMPTTATGLTVSIDIKPEDYHQFLTYINEVVYCGDINAVMNGKPLLKLEFDTTKSNYLVTSNSKTLSYSAKVYVRYGNVIYPVLPESGINASFNEISRFLSQFKRTFYSDSDYIIIFQAPPHSIAVTPSRETLSMQDHTVKTLNKIFEEFLDNVGKKVHSTAQELSVKTVNEYAKQNKVKVLYDTPLHYLVDTVNDANKFAKMSSLVELAGKFLQIASRQNIPDHLINTEITTRITALVEHKNIDRGLAKTFLDFVNKKSGSSNWFAKRMVKPLVMKSIKAGLSIDDLFIYDDYRTFGQSPYKDCMFPIKKGPYVVKAKYGLPYLRKVIVVCTSFTQFSNRYKTHDLIKKYGDRSGMFVFKSRKAEDLTTAKTLFTSMGMVVVDLTEKQAWEPTEVVRKPRKKPSEGIPLLKAVWTKKGLNANLLDDEKIEKSANPLAVLKYSTKAESIELELPFYIEPATLVEVYGDKVGIVRSPSQKEKYIQKGSFDFKQYVFKDVFDYVFKSKEIKEYLAFDVDKVLANESYFQHSTLIRTIYNNPQLKTHFKLVNNMSQTDKLYLEMYKQAIRFMASMPSYIKDPVYCAQIAVNVAQLSAIPLDPANKAVMSIIKASTLLELVDSSALSNLLRNADNQQRVDKIIQVLLTVITE